MRLSSYVEMLPQRIHILRVHDRVVTNIIKGSD